MAKRTASITRFKPSGKFYDIQSWEVPEGAIGPFDMKDSPDYVAIKGGYVLVESDPHSEFPEDENWGFPALLLP